MVARDLSEKEMISGIAFSRMLDGGTIEDEPPASRRKLEAYLRCCKDDDGFTVHYKQMMQAESLGDLGPGLLAVVHSEEVPPIPMKAVPLGLRNVVSFSH